MVNWNNRYIITWWAFVLSMFLGLALRVSVVTGWQMDYRNLLHAHSHLALMGWMYPILFLLLVDSFLPGPVPRIYQRLFYFNLVCLAGMTPAFIYNGYWWLSITFSTLQMTGTYAFARYLTKDLRGNGSASVPYIRTGLLFMVISTLGPWSLGPVMAMGMSGSDLYHSLIYFFLHFQYNGFFFFILLALLIPRHKPVISSLAFPVLVTGAILTCLLSFLFADPPRWVHAAGAFGALLQLYGLLLFFRGFKQADIKSTSALSVFAGLIFLKSLMQLMSAFPWIADFIADSRNIIIAYLHFVLLGIFSAYAITEMIERKILSFQPMVKSFIGIMTLGFLLQELVLLLPYAGWVQMVPVSPFLLVIAGAMMAVGGFVSGFFIKKPLS